MKQAVLCWKCKGLGTQRDYVRPEGFKATIQFLNGTQFYYTNPCSECKGKHYLAIDPETLELSTSEQECI